MVVERYMVTGGWAELTRVLIVLLGGVVELRPVGVWLASRPRGGIVGEASHDGILGSCRRCLICRCRGRRRFRRRRLRRRCRRRWWSHRRLFEGEVTAFGGLGVWSRQCKLPSQELNSLTYTCLGSTGTERSVVPL